MASSPFDQVAHDYDFTFSHSPIGLLQRKRVHALLIPLLTGPSLHILELNAGTGEDAIWLAQHGHHVTATDISVAMLKILSEKVKFHSLQAKVEVLQSSIDEISKLQACSFDLVFSNFGGLNCVPEKQLSTLMHDAALLLKPGGKFIGVIMGQKCIWERSYFLLKGKFKEAFRRESGLPEVVKIGKAIQQTWYYGPEKIHAIFSGRFHLEKVSPVGITIPPSYLNPFFKRKRKLLSVLNKMEAMLSFSFLSNYADHYLIVLRKIK